MNTPAHNFYVTCGRGSVLLWRQCNVLRTSGFSDDVMFSHNRANGQNRARRVCFVQFVRWRYRGEVCRLRLHLVLSLRFVQLVIFLSLVSPGPLTCSSGGGNLMSAAPYSVSLINVARSRWRHAVYRNSTAGIALDASHTTAWDWVPAARVADFRS